MNKFTKEEAKKAIRFLPKIVDEFLWKKILWSLRSEFSESDTEEIALSYWSDFNGKPGETKKEIERYNPAKKISIGTFIKEAQKYGYVLANSESYQTRKPKKEVEKWSLRYISKGTTNRFLSINPLEHSLKDVTDDDIREIKRVLGKLFSKEAFSKIGAKICISPYGIAFPPKINDVCNIETEETLWIEGKTGLLTALTIGLDSYFNIAYRHNISSKVKGSTKLNYAMLDLDDIDQYIKSIEIKEDQILFGVRPPVKDKKDFADWINESNISAEEVVEYIYNNKIENIESIDKICSKYELNDKGNSYRLVTRCKDIIRYNSTIGKWHVWDGTIWRQDETNKIQELAKSLTGTIKEEATYLSGEEAKKRNNWALRSGNAHSITNSIKLASSDGRINVDAEYFDKQNHLINCENGVYNLKDFKFYSHNQEYYFTNYFPVKYDPDAQCFYFKQFMIDIFQDFQLIDFVKRCVGLSLSGESYESVVFFGYGKGKNGKSIFSAVLELLFGKYAVVGNNDLIVYRVNAQDSNQHKAKLKGKRLVRFAELPENAYLQEALIKEITGGDTITGRFLYQNEFQFKPTHSVWIFGNHKPNTKATDYGLWRRIILIPFIVTISKEQEIPKEQLMNRFENELPGILNYFIDGYKDYINNGFNPPEIVLKAVEEYKEEQDKISDFLSEMCAIKSILSIKQTALYKAYCAYCKEKGEPPYKKAKFYDAVLDKYKKEIHRELVSRDYLFVGIDLLENLNQYRMTG